MQLSIFPQKRKKYFILTLFLIIFIITPIFFFSENLFYDILFLLYSCVITVIFEEIIFRGFVWQELTLIKNENFAYLVSTILFGIWHLGYIDTVVWRTSLSTINQNIVQIMFWKVIVGLCFGLVLGFVRKKTHNVYSSILLHSFLNSLGR